MRTREPTSNSQTPSVANTKTTNQHKTVGVKLAGAKYTVEQPNAITESTRETNH
ncbi:hypothetical protein [Catenovulum maritimum]|uniref:hypothetical protein n=1 Tax=Catenovulum maritimum TaxID=1513271 RepID=UPI0012B65BC8|nr:hypothetical protein [Catenovulum maritimum]